MNTKSGASFTMTGPNGQIYPPIEPLTPTQELCDLACILNGKEPPNRQPDHVPDFIGTLAERMAASLETHFWEQPSSLYDKLKSRMK